MFKSSVLLKVGVAIFLITSGCKTTQDSAVSMDDLQDTFLGFVALPAGTADESKWQSDTKDGPLLNTEFDTVDFREDHKDHTGNDFLLRATFVVNKVSEGSITGYLSNLFTGKTTLRLDRRRTSERMCALKGVVLPSSKDIKVQSCDGQEIASIAVAENRAHKIDRLIVKAGKTSFQFEVTAKHQIKITGAGLPLIQSADITPIGRDNYERQVGRQIHFVDGKRIPIDDELLFFAWGLAWYFDNKTMN